MEQYNARNIALDIINDITKEEAYGNIALKKELQNYPNMKQEDKGFITELVNGTLRNLFYIDYVIENFSTVKLKKIKTLLLGILRISIYQIMFMDRVPDSAACNEAVKLSKKRGHTQLSGFVNGVLRNVIRNKESIPMPNEKEEPVKFLAVKYSYPEWLIEKWIGEYGYSFTSEMCIKNNTSPNVTICANKLKTTTEALSESLIKENVVVKEGNYTDIALHLTKTSDISKLEAYQKGLFHVQDESSMMSVGVLAPKQGDCIIDVCAAPGGKSLLCAEKMNNIGRIIARDIYEHKLNLINESANRLGINIIETQLRDAEVVDKECIGIADGVIVDAPCSGLGILRKKADMKIRKSVDDIIQLQKIQRNILKAASEYVKKDGVLVYSTCTVTKEENEENMKWFVENFPFELEDISSLLPKKIHKATLKDGYIQFFPHVDETDGFFVARLKRK